MGFFSPNWLVNPSRPNPGRREKIKLNFYFHASLWCRKRFEAFKAFIKPFEAPQRSVKIKINLIFISIHISEMHGTLKVNATWTTSVHCYKKTVLLALTLKIKLSRIGIAIFCRREQKYHNGHKSWWISNSRSICYSLSSFTLRFRVILFTKTEKLLNLISCFVSSTVI